MTIPTSLFKFIDFQTQSNEGYNGCLAMHPSGGVERMSLPIMPKTATQQLRVMMP